ncbi:Hypothetical predicted protein [Olea europaea subsp. europaea]|uniref:DUF7086 domain-containing protein n=2 Tax=Olea europaea subsp. europaea TaxID=158383 RepID=A0A8S0T1M3_OLEEU|nr:Hypothetical predicted protein [Olea europaea subsp. europaea]
MATDSEINENKRRRFNSPEFQIPRNFSSDLEEEDDNDFLGLSLSCICSTASVPHPPPSPPPQLPPPLDLSRLSDDSDPLLTLELSPPSDNRVPSLSGTTVTFPYYRYQGNGASLQPNRQSLYLPPPSAAENTQSHHPVIITGENRPTLTLPYRYYQENGVSPISHPPPPSSPPARLELLPPSATSDQLVSLQLSPSHNVTGGNLSQPYSCYQEDVGPSNGTVIPRPHRVRRNSAQSPREGKSATIPVQFPWSTSYRATVHSLAYLRSKQIDTITDKVQCKRCEEKFEISFNLHQKFMEVGTFIAENKASMHDRAPGVWLNPTLLPCKKCNEENIAKPIISEKKKFVNWLFLLLGQLLGCCTLDQLKYFCKHTKNHRTGAKDRVLYLTYLGLCKQLDPTGPFDR